MESRFVRLLRFVLPQRLVARYMESKIPLPTDNLYKFLALFSLLILLSGFGLVFNSTEKTNATIFEHWTELESLQAVEKPTVEQKSRLEVLERKIEVAISDKVFFRWVSILMVLGGIFGVIAGFGHWFRRTQRDADQMSKIQLETARLQLLGLRADLKARGVDVDAV